jgi:hypothetical protein
MSGVPPGTGLIGPWWLQGGGNQFNAISFLTRQLVAGKAFACLAKVLAVHGGGVGSPPTVDVQPMVNQIDGAGNQTPHGNVPGLAVFRLQASTGAVILDPVVGDIGEVIICDSDTSIVRNTGSISGPGSFRRNDGADGCYFGSFLGATPTTYIEINAGGVDIQTAGTINIHAGGGTTIDGVPFLPHVHSEVMTGGGNSGPVVP